MNVADPQDIVELQGARLRGPAEQADSQRSRNRQRKFLSVWFRCCHAYGRLNRNRSQTAYEGRCPKCGCQVRARIGPGGTSQRMFEAR